MKNSFICYVDMDGVTKEKSEWLHENISPDAYSDVVYVPYDRSKS